MGFAASTRWLTADAFPAWESIDGFTYGSVGVDNFVFEMDGNRRRAVSIEPLANLVRLVRSEEM